MNPSSSRSPRRNQHRRSTRDEVDVRSPNSKAESGQTSNKSKNSASKHIRECACGRGLACVGMSQAFRLLGDPRCYYVELPRYRKNPPAYKYVFRNNLRAAYIRHLKNQNSALDVTALDSVQERRYIALHHFHPAVVKAFYENPLTSGAAHKHKVPISITEHELQELNMDIYQEDRILSVTGAPTGGYYFCPGYGQEKAHEDLKLLIKQARIKKEEMEKNHRKNKKTVVPENIEIATQTERPSKTSILPIHTESINQRESMSVQPLATPPSISRITKAPVAPMETHEIVEIEEKTSSGTNKSTIHTSKLFATQNELPDSTQAKEALDLQEGAERNVVLSQTLVERSKTIIKKEPDNAEEGISGSTLLGYEQGKREVASAAAIVSEARRSEFDNLWAEEGIHEVTEMVPTADANLGLEDEDIWEGVVNEENGYRDNAYKNLESKATLTPSSSPTKERNKRNSDHPWDAPKYRRPSEWEEATKKIAPLPAQFIDPNVEPPSVQVKDEIYESPRNAHKDKDRIATEDVPPVEMVKAAPHETASAAQKSAATISAAALLAMKSIDDVEVIRDKPSPRSPNVEELKKDPPGWRTNSSKPMVASPAMIQMTVSESRSFEDIRSQPSEDSMTTGAIKLQHSYPGVDPTLRIQVHNDLIAWESRRRSDISSLLNCHSEKWQALRSILRDGIEEIQFAERFVNGFAKAGIMFADSIQAIYDDKLLDDAGNTVSNSFLQNRLYKKRNAQEYSIETQDSFADSGQSALLNSILEAQVQLSNNFRDSSTHIEEELLPELYELRADIQTSAKEYEMVGDSIIAELKRSETELKNIWDVFDAMVTGDLMEYTVHGSMHGNSQHGGSIHSSLGQNSGSMHGFLTSRDGDGLIVSSVNAPLVKSTFRQLGAVEDGWLVEMYYRSGVAYQQAVFGIAENEIGNLAKAITNLEEQRFRKMQEVMLAFVPRQRRLFNALPDQFKAVLDDLIGLRIDEETLQSIIDNSIVDRSRDHLKRGASHRSAIMNRSKVSKTDEAEIESIEAVFGHPFASSAVVLSKVVELQPGGFMSMVNTSWKPALFVVTSEGNIHVFTLPDGKNSLNQNPLEAFQSLCPATDFDTSTKWCRKEEITKALIPTLTISLKYSSFSVPKMQNGQFLVTEDKPQSAENSGGGRNRFMKAMKAAADSQRSRKCTFRLSSASEVNEWISMLEQTKKAMSSKNDIKKTSRFPF